MLRPIVICLLVLVTLCASVSSLRETLDRLQRQLAVPLALLRSVTADQAVVGGEAAAEPKPDPHIATPCCAPYCPPHHCLKRCFRMSTECVNLPNVEGKPCCGPECSPISCLTLFLDFLSGLQPAVEFEVNATKAATAATRDTKAIEHVEHLAGKEAQTKLCCGPGCGQQTCLAYLAELLKELELPVNNTLNGAYDDGTWQKGPDEL